MVNKCNLCEKTFEYPYLLERHKNNKKSCNKPKESYNCEICKTNFYHKSHLDIHNATDKHMKNYNSYIKKDEIKIKENKEIQLKVLKQHLQKEYEEKLNKELELKENEIYQLQIEYKNKINNLIKENKILKFNFDDNIKLSDVNEVEQILVPITTDINNYKTLNKIDINDILTKYSKLLTIYDLLYIINYNVNKIYLNKFWNNIKDDTWLCLDEELINWFEYTNKENIINILKNEFTINNEYKIINNENDILMSSDCFKDICSLVNTIKSKYIKQCYIEVEKIFKFYLKYILEFNKNELNKSKLIKTVYINKFELQLDSILYLITTINKAKENIFKFGSTVNERNRKISYNTGTVEAERYFYVATYNCYDAITLEKRIAKLLINFKIPNESEMYQLHFTALDNIIKEACKNDNESLNKINKFITEEYDNFLQLDPIKF